MIEENLVKVEKFIQIAKKNCPHQEDITLIAVSKTKSIEDVKKAYEVGIRDFGENKVQELIDKYEALPKDIKWHMIGHLQRNKVKYIIDKVHLIHSVDSLKLAEAISKEAMKHNLCMPILIEINIANEISKFGVCLDDAEELVKNIAKLKGILIQGVMTVAPFVENEEDNRVYFKRLYEFFIDIRDKNIDNTNMRYVSMGMTGDYKVAIEEGANIVRIGTGIFGNR